MTDDLNFTEILSMQLEEIEAPQILPVGTYLCAVDGQPDRTQQVGPNQTHCIDFNLKVLQAQPDVDQAQLAEVINGGALSDRKIKHRMFVTDKSKHRLKKFLVEDLGVDSSMSVSEALDAAMGKQCYVKLTHQASKSGTVFENVLSTAHV
jgi:hypothetical protein